MKHALNKMLALDLFLSTLNETDYKATMHNIQPDLAVSVPLISWDIISQQRGIHLNAIERTQDINKVKDLAKKLHWENNIDAIFKEELFEAIVITDLQQRIVWVNKGFTAMTGYSKLEALNKTPKFLQGPETDVKTKQSINKQLQKCKPFKEVVTNYKKNGTTYKCEIKIFPLKTYTEETHFVALERKVS